MNLKSHVRRAILIVTVATSVAATAGAVGANADTGVPQDPPAADVPPGAPGDDSPPGPVAGDDAAPSDADTARGRCRGAAR